ncbi:MAG: 50S ribosomal protein L11 methyltransferase [SAR202 cluster bacterium]|nr:50S ribosomal protein L11 methyltransferase [SAR202 cluster bacterium]
MNWIQLTVTVPAEFVEPLSELFFRYTRRPAAVEQAGGFNPDEGERPPVDVPVTVTAYYPNDRRAGWRHEKIDIGLRLLSLIRPLPPVAEREVSSQEWEQNWKDHFPVLRLGDRLVLAPPWMDVPSDPGLVVVRLDPGLAFGTGHHPTTRRCLLELERCARPGMRVLDVGCGSGVLSVAAAALGASMVTALDIDESAVRATRANERLNGVGRLVKARKGTLPIEGVGEFDLVLGNLSAKALMSLAPHLRDVLAPEGVLIASGFLEGRRDEVVSALLAAGLVLCQELHDQEWVTAVLART